MSGGKEEAGAAGLVPGYSSGPELEERLDRLVARGGERVPIGRSVRGRTVTGYRWPRGGASGGVFLISLLHPMEWIGLETGLALVEAWLPDQASRPPFPIHFVPIANPDGYARALESLHGGDPRWIRGNARFVDLNRNFPTGFRPRSQRLGWWPLYRPGSAPMSEPETAAIAAWAREIHPAAAFSLHSFGRHIFYPPSCSWKPWPGTHAHAAALAPVLASSPARTGYRAGQLGRWSPFFRAHGSEIDFLHAETGALAYLVEISAGGILQWGARRLPFPFFGFNPRRPERETARIVPVLRALAERIAIGAPGLS